ncbi:MAG: hypothetical protein K8U57_30550 [Planctomycetes bacterium]|nr:hypothetical protein [Planctomycetota bacterium]
MIDFENDRRFQALVFSRGVEIPKWALLQILTALPDDTLLFHVDFDFTRNQHSLVFWSGEFEHIPFGAATPTITAWIDTVNLTAGLGDRPEGYMEDRSEL